DIVYIEYGGERADFIVSGLDQKINHMGIKGLLTDEGAERFMGKIEKVAYYIWTREGVSYDEIKSEIGKYTDASVDDMAKLISETTSTVSNSMYIICYSILAVTVMIVIFVEILLVRSKIIREYRNYGINKAIGFTSGQLMIQTMISNIPAILLGVLAGSAVTRPVSSAVMSTALMFFGIEKIEADVPFYGLMITLVGILAVAMITSLACSLSIRKVEPIALISEE
ncbi:MAG: ABC transporter permease, partial [Clostridiales bacterium]|nr:ABC transporter permease [Clostridiales bacterium]